MRRPGGVVAAAIILLLLSLVGIACAVLALCLPLLVHRPLIPKIPGVQAGLWAMLVFFLLCLWTVSDLFRMRGRARISMVAIGFVFFVASGLSIAGMLWVRTFLGGLPPGPYGQTAATVLWAIMGFYGVVALIGLWWIVYFLRAGPAFAEVQGVRGTADTV